MSLTAGIDTAVRDLIQQMNESNDSEFAIEIRVRKSIPPQFELASVGAAHCGFGDVHLATAEAADSERDECVEGNGDKVKVDVEDRPMLGLVSTLELMTELQVRCRMEKYGCATSATESALNTIIDAILNGCRELPFQILAYRTVNS